MKQTAVEFLYEALWEAVKDKFMWQTLSHEYAQIQRLILQQAKEMEKEQIKQAYLDSSQETCRSYGEEAPHDDPKFAELYYKQKYATK
jgi:hypothetical protein